MNVAVCLDYSQRFNDKDVSTKRVLIIENEADLREIVQLSLELVTNWEVIVASSSTEGLALAVSEQPWVILISMLMPNREGLKIFKHIKANNLTSQIPVILMADRVRLADQYQFLQQGAAGVIAAHDDPVELAMQISKVIN